MILDDATRAIDRYNRIGLHYNLASEGICRMRETRDPFSQEYEPYIIAGLIAFDMERMMGQGDKYELDGHSFRSRLRRKMQTVREVLQEVPSASLHQADLAAFASAIEAAYDCLAASGEGSLNADSGDQFHVGATKVLHWIAPAFFIMVDSNVAAAFRKHHGVKYRKGTQPGYTPKKYLQCLQCAKHEIHVYGHERFCQIEPATPLARLFDKAAYVAGLTT